MKHYSETLPDTLNDQLSTTIQAISRTVLDGDFSATEKRRFFEDLLTLRARLISREYLQSSFKPRNQLSIPERTAEFYQDLSFFFSVGNIWEKLLAALDQPQVATILDIGPGYFPKVELGLYYAGFAGSVTLLDQDREATARAQEFLAFFNCAFKVTTCHDQILTAPNRHYDLIVANHFLDDFGLAAYCHEKQIDLNEAYLSEKLYRALWNDLSHNPTSALQGAAELAKKLAGLLTPHGSILLVDYPSFSHRALGLHQIPRFVEQMRRELRQQLIEKDMFPCKLLKKAISHDRLHVKAEDVLCLTKTDRRRKSEKM